MEIAIICFTVNGFLLAERAGEIFAASGYRAEICTKSQYLKGAGGTEVTEPLKDWARKMFAEKDAILFIGASGIAVRAIAPWVANKKNDPAVLVMDEHGNCCISLLSGHLGGANELTRILCAGIGAIPVLTTATDVNARFAVDVFAKKNGLSISDMRLAKEVSAALLHGGRVGFFCETGAEEELPKGLTRTGDPALGIYVGVYDRNPFEQTLHLVPRCVTVGIGCRRDTPEEKIRDLYEETLQAAGIRREAVGRAASIDLKKNEPGLNAFCRSEGLTFVTYPADELLAVEGCFTASAFVSSVTGVDNVCERSAVKDCTGGALLKHKTGKNGVTTAFAVRDWSVEFE